MYDLGLFISFYGIDIGLLDKTCIFKVLQISLQYKFLKRSFVSMFCANMNFVLMIKAVSILQYFVGIEHIVDEDIAMFWYIL